MYCRIIPLAMAGGDHVMFIILLTTVSSKLLTDEGAENKNACNGAS